MKARLSLLLACLCITQCVQQESKKPSTHSSFDSGVPSSVSSAPAHNAPSKAAVVWQRASTLRSSSLTSGAQFHEFTAHNAEGTAEVSVVIFDSQRCALRILDQPTAHAGSHVLSSIMRRAGAIAGVNGGFFHPDFSTVGLVIADGHSTGQFMQSSLVSGAMVVIGQEPYLVWNSEFLGKQGVTQMVQAGPRLVDAGRPLPTLNRTKYAARSFIATDGQRLWALGTVRSTTLAGLGALLASDGLLPDMEVHRALNLDGGHSTAIYVLQAEGPEISRPGWSTVRNYVAVVPK